MIEAMLFSGATHRRPLPTFNDNDTLNDVLNHLSRLPGGFTARELGASIGCDVRQASRLLRELHAQGRVKRNRAPYTAYWIVAGGDA